MHVYLLAVGSKDGNILVLQRSQINFAIVIGCTSKMGNMCASRIQIVLVCPGNRIHLYQTAKAFYFLLRVKINVRGRQVPDKLLLPDVVVVVPLTD